MMALRAFCKGHCSSGSRACQVTATACNGIPGLRVLKRFRDRDPAMYARLVVELWQAVGLLEEPETCKTRLQRLPGEMFGRSRPVRFLKRPSMPAILWSSDCAKRVRDLHAG